MNAPLEFPYYRGVAPMMWVLVALSVVEMLAVHLFVALKWPHIGWPLSVLSALGIVAILVWIRSFRRLPHRLEGSMLELRLGGLKTRRIALAQIERVARGWQVGAVDGRDAINLAGIAYPNRCIRLTEPLRRGRHLVFIRLDDPAAFDAAMQASGVAVDP